MAADELIDVLGRVSIEVVLQSSAAGESTRGARAATSSSEFRHFISGSRLLSLPEPHLPRSSAMACPLRSPPQLFIIAA
jgi:hypothetical protein